MKRNWKGKVIEILSMESLDCLTCRLAVEAILEEAKRGKSRAEQVGAIGW